MQRSRAETEKAEEGEAPGFKTGQNGAESETEGTYFKLLRERCQNLEP